MEAALGDHGCGMSPFFHNLIATAAATGVPVKQTVLLQVATRAISVPDIIDAAYSGSFFACEQT
ncbi:hypothetical protein QTP88_026158 [Uroleucon formosanum]